MRVYHAYVPCDGDVVCAVVRVHGEMCMVHGEMCDGDVLR